MTGNVKIALADASNAQLRYYAEGVLNIEGIKPVGQSNAFLLAKIRAVVGEEVEEIELPASMQLLGTTSPAAIDIAPARSDGIPTGPEGQHFSHDPKVELLVHQTADKTRARECFINCNGDVMQIQRGKVVKIPYRHYLVLLNAKEMVARDTDEINPATGMPIKSFEEQPSYPFEVRSLPSAEEIAAWHARTDNFELRTGPPVAAAA